MNLTDEDLRYLDERYKQKDDCSKDRDAINSQFVTFLSRLTTIETQNKFVLWFLGALATGMITIILKLFTGG